MNYSVFILRRAQKELGDLPSDIYERTRDAIRLLADNPRPIGCQKLSGREGWRIRIGDYRVVYEINDPRKIVSIQHVGHRREIYR